MTLTADQLLAKVSIGPNGCWVWQGSLSRSGYARISVKRRPVDVHRLSYTIFRGEIPDGLVLDHVCRVRSCVRPDHLRAVTQKENTLAPGSLSTAALNAQRSACPRGHRLAEPNLMPSQLKLGKRSCLACNRAYAESRRRGNVIPEQFKVIADSNYQRIAHGKAAA